MRMKSKKRMKKSTLIFLTAFGVMLGSTGVYATTAFSGVSLSLHRTDYVCSTVMKTTGTDSSGFVYFKLGSSKCEAATTAIWVKYVNDGNVATKYLYLQNNKSNWDKSQEIDYLEDYVTVKGNMQLMARTASEHSGYAISGQWNPNV